MLTDASLAPYLGVNRWIDPSDAEVRDLITRRRYDQLDKVRAARRAFEFVRDEIAHSVDIKSRRVTRTGSEALRYGEGLCYSKSMLLAALFRALGIPAGLSYQRLLRGETPAEGYCVHGLTTAFLFGQWVRLDPRGNKRGIDAQFALDVERLAFTVRPELGEIDFRDNHPAPPDAVSAALDAHGDLLTVLDALPDWGP